MRKRPMFTAAVAVAVVLMAAETGLAQRWVRGRRGAAWRGRRPWYVPAQVYYYPAGPSGSTSWYYPPAVSDSDYPPTVPDYAPAESGSDYVEPAQPAYPAEEAPADEDVRPAADAAPARPDTRIAFHVLLPGADTRLWVDGASTKSTGSVRDFSSPPLDTRSQCHYVLKAQWSADGRVVTDTRRIDCYPGDRLTVDFTRLDPRATVTEEIVPREAPGPADRPEGVREEPRPK